MKAWSFIVPPSRDRIILGRNAYGAILVLERANSDRGDRAVYLLDPFRVVYWNAGGLDHLSLISIGLPEKRIPHFLESNVYDAWMKTRKTPLEEDVILAPKTPMGLGGKMNAANFQEEEIVSFYESSGPIFQKAFEKMGRPIPAARLKT